MAKPEKVVNEEELIHQAIEDFRIGFEAVEEEYRTARDDLRFGDGDQWPENIKAERQNDDRPCLRINKMPQFSDKLIGNMRASRPSISVRGVDDKSDPDTADIIAGIIRNIEAQSDAEIIYDTGADLMIRCGYGGWRLVTQYVNDEAFDQEIRLERCINPFSWIFDPNAKQWSKADGRFCFAIEDMPRDKFKKLYPNNDPCNFDANLIDNTGWNTQDMIRVAEYFVKETEESNLYLIVIDGENQKQIVHKLPEQPHQIIKERTISDEVIYWYRITSKEILEGPIKVPGKYFPLIPCYGKEILIDGRATYHGFIRHAKDAQRLYNYYRSYDAETIALAPKAPYIVTAKMISSYRDMWKMANKRNIPYLVFDPDPMAPNMKPERNIPAIANQAILQNIMIADQELHDTTGMQLASLGKKSNEQSGVAIQQRAAEADITQFAYLDNMARAQKHTAKVIISMLPEVYDTERIQRIIGDDGESRTVSINAQTKYKGMEKVFDMTVGKYDVVATVGPSYQTQRQETLDAMLEFIKILNPDQRAVIADLIANTSDWHGADRLTRRLRKLLPDGMLDPDEVEKQPPKPPDENQLKQQALLEAKLEAEQEKLELDVEMSKAKLKKERAEASSAEAEAAIKEAEAMTVGSQFNWVKKPKVD